MPKQYTELQLDAIKEIGNIASATAAGALSQILDKRINMKVPRLKIVPIESAVKIIGDEESLVAGIYSRILGDFKGGLLLTFPREDAILIVEKLLGKTVKNHALSELDTSALQEVGNIISSAFVSAIADCINKTLLISVPKLAVDMLGAVVDFILAELAAEAEEALIMEIEFEDVPRTISGHFFILPNPGSLDLLLKSVNCQDNAG